MNNSKNTTLNRRLFLRRAGTGAAASLFGASSLGRAFAQSADPLTELLQQNQTENFGEAFDAGARTALKATLPMLSPNTVQTTEQAIGQYEAIVARGGWPNVPASDRLRLGQRNPAVAQLRQRLLASGDLQTNAGVPEVYDSYVETAVRRFQVRHGITVDGIVKEQTLNTLNIPAPIRLNQLRTNLVRLRALAGSLGNRFVTVNIPAAHIEAVEGGVAVSRHTGVVGKPDRASPDLTSKIVEVNFNPYWTVPVSIVRKDLIPKMQAEPDYLSKNRIRIFDQKGAELQPAQINWYSEEAVNFRFKQDPGDHNSLGSIRINFPSSHGVYMHDTPFKNLFGEDFRFHSSGCVRVQNVRELVNWLLAGSPNWSVPQIDEAIRSGETKHAKVTQPVALYWVYVTAFATPDGVIQFRDDIYNRDGLGQYANKA